MEFYPEAYAGVNGLRMYYEIHGSGVVTAEHAAAMQRLILNSRQAILSGGYGDYIGN